jgi:Electron transfer DM13
LRPPSDEAGMKKLLLVASHALTLVIGFGLGVYFLPILIAPDAPSGTEIAAQAKAAIYSGQFRRDLKDSDALHWGEGTVSVSAQSIALAGKLAPGPDYKLYLSRQFVETEADFNRLKPTMVRVGDVKTFENFIVPVPGGIDPSRYNTVVVWCETFSQFITSAQYR